MLDKSRNFAEIRGGTGSTRFIQDGCRYNGNGKYLGKVDEEGAKPSPVPAESGTIPEDLEGLDKKALIDLATSYGIKADGRMSEETIRKKLSSNDADIPGDSPEYAPSL